MSEFRIGVDGRLHALHPSTNSAPYMDEILISPNGSLLYGVCTQDDSITAFRIDADGQLRRLPFKADTDKFPLNMTFDAIGRFAYVICRGTENARDGSRVIDQYRVNANGSLTQLSPWSVAVVGNFGCQIFSSFSKPTIFVPNDKGLTQYSVSPSGQLASPFSTNPLAASEQVFGETDDPLNLVIATGMQDVTGYGFPNELVVTRLNVAGGLGPSSVYGVDRTGRLSHVSPNQNDEGGAAPDASNQNGAAMACIAIDRRKQVLYAIDAANFHIFQFSINADGSLTALSTAPELHARPKDAVGYYYPNDRSSYLLVVAKK
jgi:6-phosphogluconolactonase (cycloisomerase 2 family)